MENNEDLIAEYKKIASDISTKKKELFKKIQNASLDIIADHIIKDSNICLILSCPGEDELLNRKVAFGQTGKNILSLFKTINSILLENNESFIFDTNSDQYQFSIINAYNHVYFREVNQAEPDENLIKEKNNIKRIEDSLNEITNLKYLVICGNNAEIAFDDLKIKTDAKKAFVSHLGNVGIRNKYKNSFLYDGHNRIDSLPNEERDKKRFELIATEVINQWRENEEEKK